MAVYRWFVGLDSGASRLPDESTILRSLNFLEEFGLVRIILADANAILQLKELLHKGGREVATLNPAQSSIKDDGGARDPETYQTKKGNQYHLVMQAHIGLDAEIGLVNTLVTRAANAHDVTQFQNLLHGREIDVFADSGSRGAESRARRGDGSASDLAHCDDAGQAPRGESVKPTGKLRNVVEKVKPEIRAPVPSPDVSDWLHEG